MRDTLENSISILTRHDDKILAIGKVYITLDIAIVHPTIHNICNT